MYIAAIYGNNNIWRWKKWILKNCFLTRNSQKKVLDFSIKRILYCLALCITAIAATAAVITAHNIRSSRSIGEEDIISPDMQAV